jgi:hypothetical protein
MSWSATVVGLLQAGYVMLDIPDAQRVLAKAPAHSAIRDAAPGTSGIVVFRNGAVQDWQPASA